VDPQGALIREVCSLLYGALTVPLSDRDGSTFRLCEIPSADRRHELEFHFRMDADEAALLDSDSFHFSHGFITGFIDLVFRRGGRYHILDWKSNWLPAWDQDTLDKGMKAPQYPLQASIYAEAVSRWLAVHDLPAGRDALGGVYYLFLRGLPEQGGVHATFTPAPFPAPREATHA
jgi:exodeoxyribonuclease V beta subunit